MERSVNFDKTCDLNLKATELRLGLPGGDEEHEASTVNRSNKRASSEISSTDASSSITNAKQGVGARPPPPKAQVVGWPPVQSHRKNCFQQKKTEGEGLGMYVKVSVDGAPFLRKIDLKVYGSYKELLKALENMFKLTIGSYSEREGYNGSEYTPTYEDKDGDWMLVGDVTWEMFTSTCKRLRIMKGSEARGFLCA